MSSSLTAHALRLAAIRIQMRQMQRVQQAEVARDYDYTVNEANGTEVIHHVVQGAGGKWVANEVVGTIGGAGMGIARELFHLHETIRDHADHAMLLRVRTPGKAGKAQAKEYLKQVQWKEHQGIDALKAHEAALKAAVAEAARHATPTELRELQALYQKYGELLRLPYNDPRNPSWEDSKRLRHEQDIIRVFIAQANRQQKADHVASGAKTPFKSTSLTKTAAAKAAKSLPAAWHATVNEQVDHTILAGRAKADQAREEARREREDIANRPKFADSTREVRLIEPFGPTWLTADHAQQIMEAARRFHPTGGAIDRETLFAAEIDGQRYFVKESDPANVRAAILVNRIADRLGLGDTVARASGVTYGGKTWLIEPFVPGTPLGDMSDKAAKDAMKVLSPDEQAKLGLFHYLIGHGDVSTYNTILTPDGKPVLIDIDDVMHDHQTTPVFFNSYFGNNRHVSEEAQARVEARIAKMRIPPETMEWLRQNIVAHHDQLISEFGQVAKDILAPSQARLDVLGQLASMKRATWGDLERLANATHLRTRVSHVGHDDEPFVTRVAAHSLPRPNYAIRMGPEAQEALYHLLKRNPSNEEIADFAGARPGDVIDVRLHEDVIILAVHHAGNISHRLMFSHKGKIQVVPDAGNIERVVPTTLVQRVAAMQAQAALITRRAGYPLRNDKGQWIGWVNEDGSVHMTGEGHAQVARLRREATEG